VLVRFLAEDKIDHRTALTIAFRLQCLLTEYSKFTLLKDGSETYLVCMHALSSYRYSKFTLLKDSSETYQVCMRALSSYRIQQVYTAQGRQWNIPGMYACIVSLPSKASLHCSRTAVTHTWYVCLHCLLTEYSKFTLLKDGSETYQACMLALSPYRVQQVYTAQGRQWNIPGMYACIVFLPNTASLHYSRTAVKHTWYVCMHCLLTEYSKITLLKDGSETYQVCMRALSPYRVQQVYTAQGRQWNIPCIYACIISLPSTASVHCSRTAVTHTRYVYMGVVI